MRMSILSCIALLVIAPMSRADEVKITKTKETIEFRIGDALVSTYHVAEKVAKPYFWPLNAKGDIPVTRAWPMKTGEPLETKDHVHQKSAWFCHGDVVPEGIELKQKIKGVEGVDFWTEHAGHGKIVCIEVGEPKHGSIVTKNEWRTADGINILNETRTITLKEVGDGRLFILDIDLHAGVCPITFADTKEGCMGVRVSDQMNVQKGRGTFENADRKINEKEIWGYESLWCDYYGKVNDKEVGIAIFTDPKNPHPSCWHAREYGLMAANPFGRAKSGFPSQKGKTELVKLAKGDHLKLRYGMYLHTGDTKTGKVAETFEVFTKTKGG
jgi:hypothetical protein